MDTESEHVVFIPSIEDFLSDNPDNVNSNQGNRLMVITNNVIGQSELTSKFNDDKNREILPFSLLVTENDHRADRYQRSKGLTQLDIKNKNIYDREDWYKQVIKYEGGPHEIIYRHFIRWWLRNQVSANTKIQDPYSYPHRPPTRDLFTFSRPPSRLIGSTNGDINMIDYTSFTSTLSATSTTTSTPEPPLPRKLFTEFASSSSIDNMDVDMD
ncbi:hypothetical protein NADFUDRAFT_84179 [Nadsonia fulvescens var. elongata DSM 6958]|uniref:Uncharacterized protein n=1 Tax=Nadsonia fulvescens var. elongata DSM 6958 TaxID=857566 RepID=A0A1E3PDQ0_9ASCO|nr:hypothetical protein NADFUDRAFT_84179 [Nadsonia fulvescens var. elongata DSM 6958]